MITHNLIWHYMQFDDLMPKQACKGLTTNGSLALLLLLCLRTWRPTARSYNILSERLKAYSVGQVSDQACAKAFCPHLPV